LLAYAHEAPQESTPSQSFPFHYFSFIKLIAFLFAINKRESEKGKKIDCEEGVIRSWLLASSGTLALTFSQQLLKTSENG
jgi:hypothetical protein